jgi:hypothetical protein
MSARRRAALRVALVASAALAPCAHGAKPDSLPVAGWLERALVSPARVPMEAKLDSGARTSSLHASSVRRYERDGEDWVSFQITGMDGRTVRLRRRLLRMATVRSALGVDEGRPVVALGICVGRVHRVTEVSLVDRSELNVPLLIGRRFLRGRLLVDLSRRHLLEPDCEAPKTP